MRRPDPLRARLLDAVSVIAVGFAVFLLVVEILYAAAGAFGS